MSWGKQIRERADDLKCTLVFPSHYDTAVLGMGNRCTSPVFRAEIVRVTLGG